ncbi:hypothetical protein GWI33_002740 [Rhynchophorus ferrugineus]|uniref:FLYWCH-type domain-containing protein n=1 Tax=Rhynchophorus ferrugineus TaxID=354439 RepID=A0A834MHG0_RHYFE|nr:hypothetical protein GWI33_002740 [Rhynchophorus ferrugineus]
MNRILEIVYFSKASKHPVLMLRNFEYRIERTTPTKTRWSCKMKEKIRCKSRLVTTGSTIYISNFEHNHTETFVGTSEKLHSQDVKFL